jgi:hypothetical protein
MTDDNLSLVFSASQHNGWPKLKFYLDDDLYEDYTFTGPSARVDIPLVLVDGEHELTIELYDKTHNNTKVVDDQIIEDQIVTLEQIQIGGVAVPDFVKYSGVYYTKEQTYPNGLTWGINGEWRVKFKMPFISWILEEKNKFNSAVYDAKETLVGDYNESKKQTLIYYLKQLEEMLASE